MNRRVLVVDDDTHLRSLIADILTAHGDDVLTAPDGVSALRLVAEKPPDVLVVDVMMPEMNGLEVLDRLRANEATASIPVLFLTALDRDAALLRGYQSAPEYHITKPFTARRLLNALDLIVGKGPSIPPSPNRAPGDDRVPVQTPARFI